MLTSIFIIAVSLVLFAYWFRYTCVLILSTRTTRDYSAEVAAANRLSFLQIQDVLKRSETGQLNSLEESLERDYQLVTYLLKQAGELQVGGDSLEHIMLRIDFRIMKACYGLTRRFSEARSRAALQEMSEIVGHFANAFGEQLASSARV